MFMGTAYLVITILLAAMVVFSAVGKLRRDPHIVRVIHEIIGVPNEVLPASGSLRVCWSSGAGSWYLVAFTRRGGWYRAHRLLRGRNCVPSACRRCQRDWTCCLSIGNVKGSGMRTCPDIQDALVAG